MRHLYQGVDVVSVERVRAVGTTHERFVEEVFGESERAYCLAQADPYVHLAGRFAAKEAAMKALGVGFTGGVGGGGFGEIEIGRRPSGQPVLVFSGWLARVAAGLGVTESSVSISHAAGVAVAVVTLVAAGRG